VDEGTLLVTGAWDHFEAGDADAYVREVAAAAGTVTDADVIVLAQASTAPAQHLTMASGPVLSSPGAGLAAGTPRRARPFPPPGPSLVHLVAVRPATG
jgi:hypothetical protein